MVTKAATRIGDEQASARAEKVRCQHYWMIDRAVGRTSSGECLVCGEKRTFPNYLSDCLIDNDPEAFEEWVAKQGRKARKQKGSWDILSGIEEGV